MFRSYFKIGWRNLVRNQGYSFINIGGLAIGMAVAMLIGLWIYDELSFNRHYQNYESIGQVWAGGTNPETSTIDGNIAMQYPAATILKNNYHHYFKHVLMAWWIFLMTVVGALLITLLTVSFQAIKAALMNPVKSLKSE